MPDRHRRVQDQENQHRPSRSVKERGGHCGGAPHKKVDDAGIATRFPCDAEGLSGNPCDSACPVSRTVE
jgi:hypothetical protein